MATPQAAPSPNPYGWIQQGNQFIPGDQAQAPMSTPDPSTLWNQAWNAGYSNSTGSNPYSGQVVGGYDIGAGFTQGQQSFKNSQVKSTPQVTQTNNNGGINQGNLNQYFPGYAGWDPNAAWNDYMATGGNGKGGSTSGQQNIDQMINGMYDPAINALSGYQDWATQQNQNELSQANDLTNQSKSALQNLTDQGLVSFNQQTGTLQSNQTKAENDMLRKYNASQQQVQSRYGGGSNTGQNLSEILLGEFLRGGADIKTGYANGMTAILTQKNNWQSDIDQRAQKIDDENKATIENINSDFKQRMADINMRRGELESAKSAARIDAMQTAVQLAQQASANMGTRLADLQNLKASYEAQLGQGTEYLNKLISNVSAEIASRGLTGGSNFSTSLLGSSQGQTQQTPLFKSFSQNNNDPYSNLIF